MAGGIPDPRAVIEILANSLIPVFAGLAAGYVAGVRKVVDNKDLRTLIAFVMNFAVPCALFTTIARAPRALLWSQSSVALVLAGVYLVSYALIYWSARRIFKLPPASSAVLSLTLGFPNAAAIGVPLLPAVYGVSSSVSAAIAIAVGAVTISPITLAILEGSNRAHGELSALQRVRVSFWKAVKRPVVWAPLLGLMVAAADVAVPSYIDKSLMIFATATAGSALFLTGLVVSAQRFEFSWAVGWSVMAKTLLQPALCLCVAYWLALPLEQTRYVVLVSAIPCGFFGVVFGKSFDVTPAVASSSLMASTLLGIVTLAGWIIVLGQLH
jgi:malonate transporter and related proteins